MSGKSQKKIRRITKQILSGSSLKEGYQIEKRVKETVKKIYKGLDKNGKEQAEKIIRRKD